MPDFESILKSIEKDKKQCSGDKTILEIYSLIDLTNLNSFALVSDIGKLCEKAVQPEFNGIAIPQVAAVCVYPTYIELCKRLLKDKDIHVASVSACFPHAQSFSEVKYLETKMSIEHGADEIDIVLNLNAFLNGRSSDAFDEIKSIKQICGLKHLKVILEVGFLKENKLIQEASLLAMEAGADFIKTSTGKDGSVASIETASTMCLAIKSFYEKTGKKIGFKPAGGISETNDALNYYILVKKVLGDDWLNKDLFRIGASRLADNLLSDLG